MVLRLEKKIDFMPPWPEFWCVVRSSNFSVKNTMFIAKVLCGTAVSCIYWLGIESLLHVENKWATSVMS